MCSFYNQFAVQYASTQYLYALSQIECEIMCDDDVQPPFKDGNNMNICSSHCAFSINHTPICLLNLILNYIQLLLSH